VRERNRLQLHLVAGALDERRGLVDRVGELNLLAGRVIVEVASAIANEITDDERHLDRVTTEARLIAADDERLRASRRGATGEGPAA